MSRRKKKKEDREKVEGGGRQGMPRIKVMGTVTASWRNRVIGIAPWSQVWSLRAEKGPKILENFPITEKKGSWPQEGQGQGEGGGDCSAEDRIEVWGQQPNPRSTSSSSHLTLTVPFPYPRTTHPHSCPCTQGRRLW